MYMRMVKMKVDPDRIREVKSFYDSVVITKLRTVPGCLFACLIRSDEHGGECVSMTLWNTKEEAEAYSKSDVYESFLEQLRPMLSDSAEWKIQLTKDLTLEYGPSKEDPEVKAYEVDATTSTTPAAGPAPESLYVRMAAPKVHAGKMEEFKKLYQEYVIPALRNFKGCRYAFLTEGASDTSEVLSVTIWDSPEAVREYENSPTIRNIMAKLNHTFSDLYRWKIGLEKDEAKKVVTSDEMEIGHYKVVASESYPS